MALVAITENDPLAIGERIEIHFKSLGLTLFKAVQIGLIEKRVESEKNWKLRAWQITDDNELVFKIEVTGDNPAVITAAVIIFAIKAAAIGVLIYLTLHGIYKIVESTGDVVSTPAGGAIGIAAVLIVGILLLKWLK